MSETGVVNWVTSPAPVSLSQSLGLSISLSLSHTYPCPLTCHFAILLMVEEIYFPTPVLRLCHELFFGQWAVSSCDTRTELKCLCMPSCSLTFPVVTPRREWDTPGAEWPQAYVHSGAELPSLYSLSRAALSQPAGMWANQPKSASRPGWLTDPREKSCFKPEFLGWFVPQYHCGNI